MVMANNNKKGLDLPFFELLNQLPVASTAVTGLTTAEQGDDRFIYGLVGSAFYRYDTYADTWQTLATPNVAPVTAVTLRRTRRRGFHGRVLAATSSTVTIPGIRGSILNNETISIQFGPGSGQDRTLTFVSETVHDAGVVTAVTASALTDGLKKWRVNQWAGYTVAITFGTDATHHRKILYNDTTTLYVADANLQPHDPWNNQAYVAASPYVVPAATAGAQTHYQIMSSTFSVNTSWDVTPTNTSYFTTYTGGIYLVSSSAGAPFYTFQYYDIANDVWQTKTTPQGLYSAALGTDFTIERIGKVGSSYVTNVGTVSATTRTLTDSGLSLENDRYANHRITIVSGTGRGQHRRIVAHSNKTFTVARSWDITPDSTSLYEVWPDFDRIYLNGGGLASMLAYSPENDYWMQGQAFDDGITNNISATLGSWMPIGVTTGAWIASGVRSINSTPTAGGTNYSIGDVLTCSVGGVGAQVRVTSIAPGGVVTGIELIHTGTTTGFTVGTGRATSGGTGTGCTIEITAVGGTALITTASAHFFRAGDSITFAGCTEAAWNAAYTIIGAPASTTFCVSTTATASMVATASQSTTVIVDPTKNWITNEHVGRLVHVMVAGTSPTSQIRWITANTATTLTVASITAAGNGTSKYVIYDSKIFGIDDQRKETVMKAYGWATGGSTTTLVDSTKNWIPNQWVGYAFKVEAGSGYGTGRITITSNTETTLTYTTQTFTPDSSTKYEIADSWGLMTSSASAVNANVNDTTKNWAVNQWAGKRVRYMSGLNASAEGIVSSNTATVISTSASFSTDTTTSYAIMSIPPRGSGIDLVWTWGASDPAKKGRLMYSPRGSASNTFDIYDISSGRWQFGIQLAPQNEGFTTGSSYTYDGADTIFASRSAAGFPIRIFELDVNKNKVVGSRTTTFLQGTVTIGNMMETVTTPDGVDFIYVLQNTGTLFARSMLF
jgi:hypothetical protein